MRGCSSLMVMQFMVFLGKELLTGECASQRLTGREKTQGSGGRTMKIEHLLGSIGNEFSEETVDALLRRSRRKITTALKHIRRPEVGVGIVKSSLGDLLVATSRHGVALIHYVHDGRDIAATLANLRLQFDPVEDRRTVNEVGKEVGRYVAGDAKHCARILTSLW